MQGINIAKFRGFKVADYKKGRKSRGSMPKVDYKIIR